MIFDAHCDIWVDVALKRLKDQKHIIRNHHLEKFKAGKIMGGIFVVWVDPPNDKNPGKRTLEILKHMAVEINENQDILHIVRNDHDFKRAMDSNKLAVIIGLEGLSGIGEDIELIDGLYLLGARHASLTWNEENHLATGVRGNAHRGLTDLGIQAVKRIQQLGMILDVSHANEKTFWDIYEKVEKPIIASHSNCKFLCDVPRNLTDEQLKAIAATGGVVGINAIRHFVDFNRENQDLHHLVNHLDHMVEIMGIEHVAFGFDYCDFLKEDGGDGQNNASATGLENASKTQNIIQELEKRGYTKENIELISYKNFYRVAKGILK